MSAFYALPAEQQAERLQAVAADAVGAWGRGDADLSLIKHRENAVFEVRHGSERTALRLHRPGYHSDAELCSELQWMQALGDAGVAVPQVIPTASGDSFIHRPVAGIDAPVQIDLFEWIDGEPLGSVEDGMQVGGDIVATFRQIGELAARVHNQASAWTPPAGFTRHAWDADGLAGRAPFWGPYWELAAADAEQRDLLCRTRDRVYADLSALPKSAANYSLIHADFVQENVLVADGMPRLIDFDDAGFGWHLFELATSLYFLQGEDFFDAAQAALIAGYRSERALGDEQLEYLPLFMLARGCTYLGWVHTRAETETARELTPMLLNAACALAEPYLASH